jgi:hypothetical protein
MTIVFLKLWELQNFQNWNVKNIKRQESVKIWKQMLIFKHMCQVSKFPSFVTFILNHTILQEKKNNDQVRKKISFCKTTYSRFHLSLKETDLKQNKWRIF